VCFLGKEKRETRKRGPRGGGILIEEGFFGSRTAFGMTGSFSFGEGPRERLTQSSLREERGGHGDNVGAFSVRLGRIERRGIPHFADSVRNDGCIFVAREPQDAGLKARRYKPRFGMRCYTGRAETKSGVNAECAEVGARSSRRCGSGGGGCEFLLELVAELFGALAGGAIWVERQVGV
jgi:hypothetical protein